MMNPSQTKSERHRQKRSERRRRRRLEKATTTISLPDNLIKEVMSFLPIKTLTRLRCVAKSFNSFISDRTFIKLHLNRSSRNRNLTYVNTNPNSWYGRCAKIADRLSFSVVRMLDNPPIIKTKSDNPNDDDYRNWDNRYFIGSCNGLICFFYHSYDNNESWFRFWNPATRAISDELGFFVDNQGFNGNFTFGYDNGIGSIMPFGEESYPIIVRNYGKQSTSL